MQVDSIFLFGTQSARLDPVADHVARIGAGLASRNELFQTLGRELRLPAYFGENWDALSDCLRDLSWIGRERVVILHEDLPPLADRDLVTYLELLYECAKDWKQGEDHQLVVVFPEETHDSVVALVGGERHTDKKR